MLEEIQTRIAQQADEGRLGFIGHHRKRVRANLRLVYGFLWCFLCFLLWTYYPLFRDLVPPLLYLSNVASQPKQKHLKL